MKQLTILYAAPEITLPGTHGGSSHVYGAVTSFIHLGHDVILITSKGPGQRFFERTPHLTSFRVPISRSRLLKNISYFLSGLLLPPILFLFRSIDIVYERSRIFGGFFTLWACIFNKQSVYELNEPLESFCLNKKWMRPLAIFFGRFISRHATLVTGTHHSFFTTIRDAHTILIDYGANPTLFSPRVHSQPVLSRYNLTPGKVVLYSGSFAPWHALHSIIAAAQLVTKKNKKIKFLLIGNGDQYSSLQNMIASRGLSSNVILTGSIPYTHMPQYINAATITLALFDRTHPHFKTHDYFYSPIKLHEYKASGKPIIASNFGNLKKYVIDGKHGYLVNESHVSQLAHTILTLLSDTKTLHAMSVFNRKEARTSYTWDAVNTHILKELFSSRKPLKHS